MVNDLLNPDPDPAADFMTEEFPCTKLKPEIDQVDVLDDFYRTDEGFLHKIIPVVADRRPTTLHVGEEEDIKVQLVSNEDRDEDVHSSGLSPTGLEKDGEEEKKSPAGIVMYDYSALSDDDDDDDDGDLFDYDRAAGPPLASP